MGCCHSRAVVSMRVQERDSGRMIDETIPSYLRSVYRVMYQNPLGRKLIKFPVTTAVLRRATARHGLKMDSPESANQIAKFIETYGVNVDEVELPLSSYATFNDFFARKLKPGVRPIACPNDDSVMVSPADCRLLVFPSVEDTTKLWLKGQDFTIASLLGPDFQHLLQHFHSPAVAIARLAPQDYHRWHLPISSSVGPRSSVSGTYFSVSPRAVREVNILCTNKREVCMFDSDLYGKWCMIAVGAAMVSSIQVADEMKEGRRARKGDEHGEFRFGGSTLILLFDSKAIVWDDDLVSNSRKPVETYVKVGTRIGRSRKVARSEQQQEYGRDADRSVISPLPSPTSPGIVHTATTDAARKEAALNDEGLLQDFPYALQSNLTLLERDEDTVKARGVPSHTRARLDAAEAVNADTSSRRGSTVDSLLPSFFTGTSAGDQEEDAESPSASPPSLERSESDPSGSSRSPLPAPAVFHLVQFTAEDDGEEGEEGEEDEDEEMGESSQLMQSDQYQQAASASPASSSSAASASSNKKKARSQQQFGHASSLMPPSASAVSASAHSSPSRPPKRRSRTDSAEGDATAARHAVAAGLSADPASTADEEEEQPKVKKAKKRGSRK